jgi:hypothetical protein
MSLNPKPQTLNLLLSNKYEEDQNGHLLLKLGLVESENAMLKFVSDPSP